MGIFVIRFSNQGKFLAHFRILRLLFRKNRPYSDVNLICPSVHWPKLFFNILIWYLVVKLFRLAISLQFLMTSPIQNLLFKTIVFLAAIQFNIYRAREFCVIQQNSFTILVQSGMSLVRRLLQ